MDRALPKLQEGRVYTAEELAQSFGFRPYYLRTAGGMVSVPAKNSLLLITHAAQDASFEYGDYWDGEDLIYTGRGQEGDQKLAGANRDVAENRRSLWIFEHHGKYQRRFLGNARCTRHWWTMAPDKKGVQRRVVRLCLRLGDGAARPQPVEAGARLPTHRRSRPFDEMALPGAPASGVASLTPDDIAQLTEKANATHHQLLVALKRRLELSGWTDIEEIPAAVDLWARREMTRVIFEAKSIPVGKELAQTRAALSQLLEYRFFYGLPSDMLCLVTDVAISDRRVRFLNAIGIHLLCFDGKDFQPCGQRAQQILAAPNIVRQFEESDH